MLTEYIRTFSPIRHAFQSGGAGDALTQVWRNRPVYANAFSVIADVTLGSGPNGLICAQRSQRDDGGDWLVKGFDLLYTSGVAMWRCFEDHATPHGRSLELETGRTLIVASYCLTSSAMTSRLWTPDGSDEYTWATSVGLDGWQAVEGTPLVVGFGMLNNGDTSALCDSPCCEFAVVPGVLTLEQLDDLTAEWEEGL